MNQELGAKLHKGVEIELCSIAICILRIMRSHMLNVCMFAVSTTVTLYTARTQVYSSALWHANHEKQVVGVKVGFSAAGNGEQFWESIVVGFWRHLVKTWNLCI